MFAWLKSVFVKGQLTLVFDMRKVRAGVRGMESSLLHQRRWQLYLSGELPVTIVEGPISRLFDRAPYLGEPRFEIDGEGPPHNRSFFCEGNQRLYIVGRYARVEHAPIDPENRPVVTRVWLQTNDNDAPS
jgi:hypothetical protein